MSMKKRFKRIAVLAIAALGMGALSVVPASATVRAATLPAAFANQTGAVGKTTSVNVVFGTIADDIDAACGQLAGEFMDRTSRSSRLKNIPIVRA